MTAGSCAVAPCARPAERRGMCTMHYRRVRRTGFTEPAVARAVKSLASFSSLVGPPTSTGCTEWTGQLNPDGYGIYGGTRRGRENRAHRIAWILIHGPIAPGLFVCHRCDNPSCVNVEHLFLGAPRDNVADMVNKGRYRTWATRDDTREVCRNGHELTPENTYKPRPGSTIPRCRQCTLDSNDRSRRKVVCHHSR